MPSGRLTMNWVGKDQALLTTPDGGYEWVDRTDPRMTEIRLLEQRETVGEVGPNVKPASDNLLIVGDAGDALRSLLALPEYAVEYRGKVKLVYIDTPFNTGQAFEHYDDALEHSVWLTMMRDRLTLVRDLLAPDGSVWVHLDDAEMAYCKVILDELFGRRNHVAHLVLEINPKGRQLDQHYAASHDHLMVYARNIDRVQIRAATAAGVRPEDFPLREPDGRKYRTLPLRNTNKKFNPKTRPNLSYPMFGDADSGEVVLEPQDGYVRIMPVFGDGSNAVWRWGKPKATVQHDELVCLESMVDWVTDMTSSRKTTIPRVEPRN